MATIKTQLVSGQPRIITKLVGGERRVSCSCCEPPEGCCMYPAEGLVSGLYSFEDLPDTMNEGSLVKLSEPEIVDTPAGPLLAYYFDNYTGPFGGYGNIGYLGFFQLIPEIGWGTCTDFACGIVGNCLGGDSGLGLYPDDFADTYTVSFLDKSLIVVRESLCFWFGQEEIDGFLYEAEVLYNDETHQWNAGFTTVDISSGRNPKDGPQNTPIGTYSGEYTITVS